MTDKEYRKLFKAPNLGGIINSGLIEQHNLDVRTTAILIGMKEGSLKTFLTKNMLATNEDKESIRKLLHLIGAECCEGLLDEVGTLYYHEAINDEPIKKISDLPMQYHGEDIDE